MCSLIAQTAVEKTLYSFDKPFDYIIPNHLKDKVFIGSRVLVPFGYGNNKRQAIVTRIYETAAPDKKLKEIYAAPDNYPLLTNELTELSEELSRRCFCTRFDVIKAMLPIGINYKVSSVYNVAKSYGNREFTPAQQDIISVMPPAGKQISQESLFKKLNTDCETKELCELLSIGVINKSEKALRKVRDASETMLRVIPNASAEKLTPRRYEVYETLLQMGEVSEKELRYFTGAGKSVIDGLISSGVCETFTREFFRTPDTLVKQETNELVLTDEQNEAYQTLLSLFEQNKAAGALLYGVTGSGKTSVFMKLMEQAVKTDSGVIVMVPEIALTPQLVSQFKARFGQQVAIFHSALSMGERLDEWKRVRFGEAKIAVGTRSAVFAPFEKIGLIIIDEEQEYTYKSEKSPRFHARDTARLRCTQHGALLLLSSATPSVETYYYAKQGAYTLCPLNKRYGNAVLPDVKIFDMNENRAQQIGGFSDALLQRIDDNLRRHEQSILLLNRRGYHTAVTCGSCNEAIACPSCSISLTYHSANNRLMCHYCGFSMKLSEHCPKCGSNKLNFRGSGTQRAEETLSQLFPNARVLRLDADSTLAKQSHEVKLNDFRQGNYDILLGTQMVAKGLDFPNVTLVGVLSADQTMYGEDYRCSERAFSLLTQVVGRSGRGSRPGEAIIQTYTPENPLIGLAAAQNYDTFFNSEIELRRAMLYPPFVDICMIGVTSENEIHCREGAQEITQMMCSVLTQKYPSLPIRILGPSVASVYRVSGRYRYKIIIKCRNNELFHNMLSEVLIGFSKDKRYKDVSVFADVDPELVW